MYPCELLQTMMDDGAWEGKQPVDIGDGFAVSPGEAGIAVFGEYFGGMVAVPWDVVRKLADYLPNGCLHRQKTAAVFCTVEGNVGRVSYAGGALCLGPPRAATSLSKIRMSPTYPGSKTAGCSAMAAARLLPFLILPATSSTVARS